MVIDRFSGEDRPCKQSQFRIASMCGKQDLEIIPVDIVFSLYNSGYTGSLYQSEEYLDLSLLKCLHDDQC
jgi:hypothetical protein